VHEDHNLSIASVLRRHLRAISGHPARWIGFRHHRRLVELKAIVRALIETQAPGTYEAIKRGLKSAASTARLESEITSAGPYLLAVGRRL